MMEQWLLLTNVIEGQGREALTFDVSPQCGFFFPLLYCKAKQRTKKNSQEGEEKLQALFPDLHRGRRRGPWVARSRGTGKPWNPPHGAPHGKGGTYHNVQTLIRDNWKWGLVFEPVSGLLVDYVKVHCQKLWENICQRSKNRHPQSPSLWLISRVIRGLGAADTGPVLQLTGRTTEEWGDAGQESREWTEGRSQLPRIRWVPHTLPVALTPKDTCFGD